jgi:valyl-tRNA synthetase
METTINPKDLILVEKITPFITRELLHTHTAKENDIIFFQQPPKLIEYIKEQESKENFNRRKTLSSDLIVKRVKKVIDNNDNHYYDVRGDNSDYSVDSRMIGPVDEKYLVGKPLLRLYPNFGTLDKK